MKFSRSDKSLLAEWWFTVDRTLLPAIIALIGIGLVLSLAASPSVALKKGLPAYYFVERHVIFSAVGLIGMLSISLMSPLMVRRFAGVLLAIAFAGLLAVAVFGDDLNGARRWLSIMGQSVQPSEFAKPAFAVVSAWLFSETYNRPDMPALSMAVLLYVAFAALLVIQPDIGQTLLISIVWATLYFVSAQPLVGVALFGAITSLGLAIAYAIFPHVAFRLDTFLNPPTGEFTQSERAMRSFAEGGFFGRGPGEGTIKNNLPDAHTDYILAVVAEEYGALACMALVALFALIVLRALMIALREPDAATRLGIIGLALLFGFQALINMGVNVGLLPAKGMTLPFISAGGSSMLAVSVTLGMLLALTRRRPDLERLRPTRQSTTFAETNAQEGDTQRD